MPVTLSAHAAAVLPLCQLRWLPPAALVGSELPLATWLQHGSSVVGSLVVLIALVRRYPELPETPGGRDRDILPVLLPTVALGALLLGTRLARSPPSGPLDIQLRWLLWHVLAGALAGLTLGCVLVRLRTRRQPGEDLRRATPPSG